MAMMMQMNTIASWSTDNHMKLNATKTKEMFISFCRQTPNVPSITVDGKPLERVDCVTLLGVKLSSDLSWHHHVDHILKKANPCLYSLNMLKRAKVSPKDITQIFCSRIRPILEYAAPVWHGGLTKEMRDNIEAIQKRALKIALPSLGYKEAMDSLNIVTLQERREDLCKCFFKKIKDPNDKLNKLLPHKTNSVTTRHGKEYPLPKVNTNRFKDSFIPYALFNLQD